MQEKNKWIFSAQQLAFYMEELAVKESRLSLIPQLSEELTEKDRERLDKEKEKWAKEDLSLLESCLRILASPDTLLQAHINLVDSIILRLALAHQSASPGLWVALAPEKEAYRLVIQGDSELKFSLIDSLGAGEGLGKLQMAGDLSTPAALAFLAILDQYKKSHLLSMLNHLQPLSVFSKTDVQDWIKGAGVEDFRWLIPLVDKLVPLDLSELGLASDASSALKELVGYGFIDQLDEEGNLFDLGKVALTLGEGYQKKLSAAVIGRTVKGKDENLAHDVFLLIRMPDDLLLCSLSGQEASLVAIHPEELQNLLDALLSAPSLEDGTQADGPPKTERDGDGDGNGDGDGDGDEDRDGEKPLAGQNKREEKDREAELGSPSFCKYCGKSLAPKAAFCPECGKKL